MGNYSFIPIRTTVTKTDMYLKRSMFFMNNDHFTSHQKGKLMAFNASENKPFSKMIYRSI